MKEQNKTESTNLYFGILTRIALLSNNFHEIIEMKERLDSGEINEKIKNEWRELIGDSVNHQQEIEAIKKSEENKKSLFSIYSHPFMMKFNWFYINYIHGIPERFKLIFEENINTLPHGNEIFYNSVKSHEAILSFLIKKEGIEKFKERVEMDNLFFPDKNSTKSANRALNNILSKKDLPVFETILSKEKRTELCNEIIANNGNRIGKKGEDNRLFVDITSNHKLTLMYLLGGDRPEEIVPIKYAVNSNIYSLLKSITDVDGKGTNLGKKVVPMFMCEKICPEILRDKNGDKFDKIKQ